MPGEGRGGRGRLSVRSSPTALRRRLEGFEGIWAAGGAESPLRRAGLAAAGGVCQPPAARRNVSGAGGCFLTEELRQLSNSIVFSSTDHSQLTAKLSVVVVQLMYDSSVTISHEYTWQGMSPIRT